MLVNKLPARVLRAPTDNLEDSIGLLLDAMVFALPQQEVPVRSHKQKDHTGSPLGGPQTYHFLTTMLFLAPRIVPRIITKHAHGSFQQKPNFRTYLQEWEYHLVHLIHAGFIDQWGHCYQQVHHRQSAVREV